MLITIKLPCFASYLLTNQPYSGVSGPSLALLRHSSKDCEAPVRNQKSAIQRES
jgi:hypothetical protein